MGSAHAPNIRAACFIRDELAAAFPAVQFEALGSVCVELTGALLPNLVARGVVDDFLNSEILRSWDIALNPVATGGGSSLKLPDYLAHGLPP
jgi:hypothetical protein